MENIKDLREDIRAMDEAPGIAKDVAPGKDNVKRLRTKLAGKRIQKTVYNIIMYTANKSPCAWEEIGLALLLLKKGQKDDTNN